MRSRVETAIPGTEMDMSPLQTSLSLFAPSTRTEGPLAIVVPSPQSKTMSSVVLAPVWSMVDLGKSRATTSSPNPRVGSIVTSWFVYAPERP